VTLGVASGGLLLGHWLVYLIVRPDASVRGVLLAGTGHAYLGAVDRIVLVASLAAFATAFLGRITRAEYLDVSLGSMTARLAGLQVSAFVAMEIAERLAAGSSEGPLLHGPILPAGIVVQTGIAALGAVLIHLVREAADRAESLLGASPRLPRPASFWPSPPSSARPAHVAVPVAVGRGPPSSR
jgi:hypothetical protein